MPEIVTSNQFFGLPPRPDPGYFVEGMKLAQDQQSTQQTNAFNQRKMELLEDANVRNQNRDVRAEAKETREAAKSEQEMTEKDIEQIHEHGAKFIESYDENDPDATETFANAGIGHLEAIYPTMKKAGKLGEAAMASVVALIKKAKDVTTIPQGTPERMAAEASFRKGIIGIRETWMGAKPAPGPKEGETRKAQRGRTNVWQKYTNGEWVDEEGLGGPMDKPVEQYTTGVDPVTGRPVQISPSGKLSAMPGDSDAETPLKLQRRKSEIRGKMSAVKKSKATIDKENIMTTMFREVISRSDSTPEELLALPDGAKIPAGLKKEAFDAWDLESEALQEELDMVESKLGGEKSGKGKPPPPTKVLTYVPGKGFVAE